MWVGIIIMIVTALMACAGADTRTQQTGALPLSNAHLAELGRGNNEFACHMYGRLKEDRGNLFFSPYSLRTALAMAYAGAKGETAAQMKLALRFTLKDEALHAAFARTAAELAPPEPGGYRLTIANSLWGQKGYKWQDPFLNITNSYYGSGLSIVDFMGDMEAARKTINAWVENKTNDRIKDLIPKNGLSETTRLALVNAIWFKGDWLHPFRKAATKDEPFYVSPSEKVSAPMMHRRGRGYRYAATDGLQILELPYQGAKLSMFVLLPKARDGLTALESMLTVKKLHQWMERAAVPAGNEVDVYLPKFRMVWGTTEMTPFFKALGMTIPFASGKADFSGMNGVTPPNMEALSIAAIFHKAFVEVNEEGTEAAAATAVGMKAMAMPMPSTPTPVFRADHPFIFLIRDNVSGGILFLGRLMNPKTQA